VPGPLHLLEPWFTRTLRDGIALAATASDAPSQIAAQARRIVAGNQTGLIHRHHGPDHGARRAAHTSTMNR
jgi:hypothetical protein